MVPMYFDNNATTALAPEALQAMLPVLKENYGNPSSPHTMGLMAKGAMDHAREQLATLLNCDSEEIRFNSGATEGINHILRGIFEALPKKRHFVTSAVEHPAVLSVLDYLKRHGAKLSYIGVDSEGRLDLAALESAIRPDTALVSVMAANHETGVIFPLDVVARITKEKGSLLHVDATQAIGRLPFDLQALDVDLLTLSAHKFHGPKGTGAIIARRGLALKSLIRGGTEEGGLRGGTENVPGIVGMGAAAALANEQLHEMDRIRSLRDMFEKKLKSAISDVHIHGSKTQRLPNTSLVSFPDRDGEELMLGLDAKGICVSTGSACASGSKGISHVLKALGTDPTLAKGTLRISMSRYTLESEVQTMLEKIISIPS